MWRTCLVVLALAGCDRVFGLDGREPLVDAATDASIDPDTDASIDVMGYAREVLADLPVSYYRMGEATGGTCIDSAGDIHGTYGGTFALNAPGALFDDPDTAVRFGPGDTGVLFGDVHEFAGTAPFTIEAWANITVRDHYSNIVAKYTEPPGAIGYIIYVGYGRLGFARGITENGQTLIELHDVDLDRFIHIVGTYDGAQMRLYVDGTLVGDKASAIALPDGIVGFTIGSGNGSLSSSPAVGTIDEVAIYDRALPPDRVFAHYTAARPPR